MWLVGDESVSSSVDAVEGAACCDPEVKGSVEKGCLSS